MSANIKVGNAELGGNVDKIRITGDNNNIIFNIVRDNGATETVSIKTTSSIRIEADNNIYNVKSNLNLTVIGNVNNCKVGNSLFVEGFVDKFECTRNSIRIQRDLKITYGNEWRKRNNYDTKRCKIVHITGELSILEVNIINRSVEIIIKGDIKNASVSNVMQVKGNVIQCKVGNMIEATMGKSTGKSTKQIIKERKENQDNIKFMLDSLFNSTKT